MLKAQFDRVIGELEDLARRETDLNDENQRLERLEDPKLQEDANRERLENQQAGERENAERMRDLAQRMEQLFKDANRNGDIEKDTMKKMAESMQSMKELGNQDMPKVEKKLGDAADQRNTPEQSKKDVQQALEEQKKVLEKMKQAIEQANEANRNFEASTFVNRLKKAASEQDGVAASLIEAFERALGIRREELDPAELRRLDDSVRQQSQTTSDVRWIKEDLGHFFARTQKPVHRELLDAMNESKIDVAMEENRQRIARNEGFRGVDSARHWANQLREWAKKLEDDKNSGGGGGGGGGGGSPEDEDFEFMLRVMRMVQQEQDLRARTRVLEQLRRSLNQATPGLIP
jgi:tetratricopeptide (TPR) repeat protein